MTLSIASSPLVMRESAIPGIVGRAELLAYLFSEASAWSDGRQSGHARRMAAGPTAGPVQLIDSGPVQLIKHEPLAVPAATAATIEPHPLLFPSHTRSRLFRLCDIMADQLRGLNPLRCSVTLVLGTSVTCTCTLNLTLH